MAQAILDERQLRFVLIAYELELPEESPLLRKLADQAGKLPPHERLDALKS
jgi:hypothetical protein